MTMMSPENDVQPGLARSKFQTGRSRPAVETTARPMAGRTVEEALVRGLGDDVLLGHELEEVGDGLEQAEAARVGRAHPVLEPGVDLAVEPLAEGRIDEQEEEPGVDEEIEEGSQNGHTAFPFTGAFLDRASARRRRSLIRTTDSSPLRALTRVTVRSAQQMQGSMAAKIRGMSAMKPFRSISTVAG